METVKLDLEIRKGTTKRLTFQWLNTKTQVPYVLTGCVIKLQVRDYANAPSVILELSTTNGYITITDGLLGKWSVHFPRALTEALTQNAGVYDIDILYPSNDLKTPVEGVISFKQGVTIL